MVRKITSGEYLKRVDNMTAAERSEYLGRVGGWLSVSGQDLSKKGETFEARLQNVLQVSVGWNDQECAAFEEGAVLLSALVGVADTKLPELLYAISAKRSIKRMLQLLRETEEQNQSRILPVTEGDNRRQPSQGVRMRAGAAKEAVIGADMKKLRQEAPPELFEQQTMAKPAVTPARPKHFDQYAHLLPKKTQDRIAKYGDLMREFDLSREKLRLLMNDQTTSAGDREAWAKKVTKIDKEIGDIRREADAEWEKVVKSGRVVVDEFGVARIVPTDNGQPATDNDTVAADAASTRKLQDAALERELTSEEKARRRSLRKWLTDTRNGKGEQREKHVGKWRENFREYLTIEGEKAFDDEKIVAAAGHYGIEMEELRINKQ